MTEPVFSEPEGSLPAGVIPVGLGRDDNSAVIISWSDGVETRWTALQLRKACPCATCREKKRGEKKHQESGGAKLAGLPVLSAAEAQPLTVTGMKPVGSYAYNVRFSDGHSSGIYPMQLLRLPS
ncbi:MAG TPA: DUF971 domain-containing protein [Rhodopirellula sp.]|nr:DUF971 domain-containing protein [Rhodopirellula sp.]